MKVGLIDVDSKIPNLALMKISAYYKKVFKYKVELTSPLFVENYDMVFASKVFTYSYMPILEEWVNIGGSGIDLKSKLGIQAEHMMPDYSLYPKINYSLGFTTRGCHRECQFCIVPQKEGKIKFNADINEFWNPEFKDMVLLDNNIFALKGQFERIADQILSKNLEVDFNQGLDIRLLTNRKAMILKKLKPIYYWRFAWDNLKEKDQIMNGLGILKKHKFRKRGKKDTEIMFYILIGYFEKDYDEAMDLALRDRDPDDSFLTRAMLTIPEIRRAANELIKGKKVKGKLGCEKCLPTKGWVLEITKTGRTIAHPCDCLTEVVRNELKKKGRTRDDREYDWHREGILIAYEVSKLR